MSRRGRQVLHNIYGAHGRHAGNKAGFKTLNPVRSTERLRRGLTSSDVSIIIAIAECRQGERLSSHQDQDKGDSSLMSGLHTSSLWTCSSVKKYKTPVSGSLAVVVFIGTPTTFLWLSLLHKREQIRERC